MGAFFNDRKHQGVIRDDGGQTQSQPIAKGENEEGAIIESSESFVLSPPRSAHDLGVCRGRFWREYPNNHSLECTNWDGIV